MGIHTISEFYDAQISTYDSLDGYSYWEILYQEYDIWTKKHLSLVDSILADLGCGTGLTSDALLEKNNTVFGLDMTRKLLQSAAQRHQKNKFHVIEGDITNLPFADEFFDGVLCLDVLEHINDVEQALKELARICKKGATCIFDIPSSKILDASYYFGYYGKTGLESAVSGLYKNKTMFEWEITDDAGNTQKLVTYRYNPKYFEKLIQSCGLSVFDKQGVHISTMMIPEKIQANSNSAVLSKINGRLRTFDGFLNKIPFFQNRALYILFACKRI